MAKRMMRPPACRPACDPPAIGRFVPCPWRACSGRRYRAGGIETTVAATRAAGAAALRRTAGRLAAEARRSGTTTLEVKSGYGLDVEHEALSCRIAAELTDEVTFLGAHVVPRELEHDRAAYLDLVRGPMLAACAPHARWADAFCERGAFDADECRAVLAAAAARGLGLRVHANQLGPGPGVQLAVELGAASADHCTAEDSGSRPPVGSMPTRRVMPTVSSDWA